MARRFEADRGDEGKSGDLERADIQADEDEQGSNRSQLKYLQP